MSPVIEIEELRKVYRRRRKVTAVDGLDLEAGGSDVLAAFAWTTGFLALARLVLPSGGPTAIRRGPPSSVAPHASGSRWDARRR